MYGVERKDYETEPIVPLRYSKRLAATKEAQKEEMLKFLNNKAKELEMAEDSKVNPKKRNRFNSQGRDKDSGIGLSASESINQYNAQDLEKHNTFTQIRRSNDSTIRQNFTGTSFGGFNTLPLGNISLQAKLSLGASLSKNEDRMISLQGLTLKDFGSALKAYKPLQNWVSRNPLTFIKEVEANYQLKYRFDSDDSDEYVFLDDVWQDGDKEIDLALERLNSLEKEWHRACNESQPKAGKENTKEEKKRIKDAISAMNKAKKEAQQTVEDLDPTLFTGGLDAASSAEIEKLLLMAITYRPPDMEKDEEPGNGRGHKSHQEEANIAKEKGKKKEVKKKKESNLTKRQFSSGTRYGSTESCEQAISRKKK